MKFVVCVACRAASAAHEQTRPRRRFAASADERSPPAYQQAAKSPALRTDGPSNARGPTVLISGRRRQRGCASNHHLGNVNELTRSQCDNLGENFTTAWRLCLSFGSDHRRDGANQGERYIGSTLKAGKQIPTAVRSHFSSLVEIADALSDNQRRVVTSALPDSSTAPAAFCRRGEAFRRCDASASSRCLRTNGARGRFPCCADLAIRGG